MTQNLPSLDENRALKLVLELLPLPGLSGKESAISAFIIKKLRAAGVPAGAIKTDSAHKQSPLGGELGNLICTLPGTYSGDRRLLMAHLDTVPLCDGAIPSRPLNGYIRSGNPQTALGADNRSGIAATLNALLEILRRKLPHPPLTFVWPVQEEVGLYGARYMDLKLLKNPRLCFNWDGGNAAKVSIGATGAYRIHIAVKGMASHAGVHPEHGISATAIAGCAIADLQSHGWHGLIQKGTKRGTSNIGAISGGNATNIVTPLVTLRIEARSHDPVFRKKILSEIRGAFERAAKRVKNVHGQCGKVEIDANLHYESFRLPENSPPVLAASRAIQALGMKPELNVANGGLDANWLSARGLPTVTLGAGQENPHTLEERLNIKAFLQGCRVALALAAGM